jgi:hypothetical protein
MLIYRNRKYKDYWRDEHALTLKPLYHSLMVASSYLVCDFKKSMSSLDSLSLLPKQPMSATQKKKNDQIFVLVLIAHQISIFRIDLAGYCGFRSNLIWVKNIFFIVFLSTASMYKYIACALHVVVHL